MLGGTVASAGLPPEGEPRVRLVILVLHRILRTVDLEKPVYQRRGVPPARLVARSRIWRLVLAVRVAATATAPTAALRVVHRLAQATVAERGRRAHLALYA